MQLERRETAVEGEFLRGKARPLLGLVLGLVAGAFLCFLALVVYSLRGPGTFDRLGVPLGTVLGLYIIGGAVGGALIGLMLPLTIRREGAAAVGIVGALPLYLAGSILLGQEDLYSGAIAAVIVGGAAGFLWWEPPPTDKQGNDGLGS